MQFWVSWLTVVIDFKCCIISFYDGPAVIDFSLLRITLPLFAAFLYVFFVRGEK